MITSPEVNEIFEALAKAQGQFEPAKLDSENPYFKSKYASLGSILNACRSALSVNGLAIVQTPEIDTDNWRIVLITRLCHSSGQWIETKISALPAKDDIQGLGSAITYLKRYSLSALLGIYADEDNDGHSEQQNQSLQNKTKQNKPSPQKKVKQDSKIAFEKLLNDIAKDFEILEDEAKEIFKASGFASFEPKNSNAMYKACKNAYEQKILAEVEQEPLFDDMPTSSDGAYSE